MRVSLGVGNREQLQSGMVTKERRLVTNWLLGQKDKDQETETLVLPAWLTENRVKPQAESQEMGLGWAKYGESGFNPMLCPGWE